MRGLLAIALGLAVGGAVISDSGTRVRERSAPATVRAMPADSGDTDVTLYLIGDAGVPHPGFEPVLAALTTEASAPTRAKRVIVFLGDNIYPRGMPPVGDPGRAEAERRINDQMAVAQRTGAQTIFIPGNHDWDHEARGGWDAIRREGEYVRTASHGTIAFWPADGCPGPVVVDVGATVRLVLLDTQWWLQHGPRPGPGSSCPAATPDAVVDSLRAALAGAGNRRAFVLSHHPLESGGAHSGRRGPVGLFQHLIDSDQDLFGPRNKVMRAAIERAFTNNEPVIYASGHDHALQVIGAGVRHYLVSGAGDYEHLDPVHRIDSTYFEREASGYMRLDVIRGGPIRLGVHQVDGSGGMQEVFTETWP
ncbi:MAG TPA: metallophosphoesterase [Gemmatimonadaceae bacterium]|nr:metallophosphoesterase [Gemmatimonadaceae bacterium]